MSLQNEVQNAMQSVRNSQESASRLCYNPSTRRLEITGRGNDPDRVKPLCHQDMNLSCLPVVVLGGSHLGDGVPDRRGVQAAFAPKDNETVFSTLAGASGQSVPGSIVTSNSYDRDDVAEVGSPGDKVRVLLSPECVTHNSTNNGRHWPATGYVKRGEQWVKAMVIISPVIDNLFSRFGGILETDVISDKKVVIVGLGSVGSPVALGLAKSGVMNSVLIDYDRLEVGNVLRHEAGLSEVGRLKTDVVKDMILNKNPFAKVQVLNEKVSWESIEHLRPIVKDCDIVIAVPDNREAKSVLNRLCLDENIPLIIAGAFGRAYGGQILHVTPCQSPCFTCFIDSLPDVARDNEVSSIEQTEGIVYADREVPIEPGLANDIAPINQMVVKEAIQILVQGKDTTLQSLDDDLTMPLHLWLNRREKDTCYEDLPAMKDSVSAMTIMRWYGVDLPRNPNCPDCGDFEAGVKARYGAEVNQHKEMEVV